MFRIITLILNHKSSYEAVAHAVTGRKPMENFFTEITENFIAETVNSDGWEDDSVVREQNRREAKEIIFEPAVSFPAPYVNSYFWSTTNQPLSFSVVIPTYNGAQRIAETITSLLDQQGDFSFEIIVVDDGSNDSTPDVVKAFLSQRRIPLSYVRLNNNFGPSTARNVGILQSRKNFICFTDDDCTVPSSWLASFAQAFTEHREVAAVGGWYHTHGDARETIFDRYLYWHKLPYIGRIDKSFTESNLCGNTANICYRREALLIAHGFNPVFRIPSMDDWELRMRFFLLKLPMLSYPISVLHRKHLTLKGYIRHVMVRAWARYILFKIYHLPAIYLNVTIGNLFILILLEWRSIFTSNDGRAYLDFWTKIQFLGISITSVVASWLGKFLIPLELAERQLRRANP